MLIVDVECEGTVDTTTLKAYEAGIEVSEAITGENLRKALTGELEIEKEPDHDQWL